MPSNHYYTPDVLKSEVSETIGFKASKAREVMGQYLATPQKYTLIVREDNCDITENPMIAMLYSSVYRQIVWQASRGFSNMIFADIFNVDDGCWDILREQGYIVSRDSLNRIRISW